MQPFFDIIADSSLRTEIFSRRFSYIQSRRNLFGIYLWQLDESFVSSASSPGGSRSAKTFTLLTRISVHPLQARFYGIKRTHVCNTIKQYQLQMAQDGSGMIKRFGEYGTCSEVYEMGSFRVGQLILKCPKYLYVNAYS